MMNQVRTCFQLLSSGIAIILCAGFAVAQEQPGPQAPAPVASTDTPPASAHSQPASSGERLMVPQGTRLPLILHNAVTTRNAGPGDAIYLETTFPITQNSRILIPAGSYVQGEILEAKRPGKVKGRGEVRIRMTTLIFPNGYTVNLNAVPHNAGTGGNESADNEGKIKGDSDKAHDVGTIMKTTGVGAGIGGIAGRSVRGAAVGAGIGAAVGLATVLLTRGPELELPRGTAVDVVLDHPLYLEADKIQFSEVGHSTPLSGPGNREPLRTRPL
ncbi:MAG TPA: TrbI/VirB10 family protein [Candidatus Dormibacteraeota bacterium]|nr:TrbI/VirB10 family protein [Candidatus Dormibacteraeota bacterium]